MAVGQPHGRQTLTQATAHKTNVRRAERRYRSWAEGRLSGPYHRAVVEMYRTNSVKGRGSEEAPQLRHTHCGENRRLLHRPRAHLRHPGGGAGRAAHLLVQGHGELLVRDAALGGAHVGVPAGHDVEVDPLQDVLLVQKPGGQ